MDLTNGHNKGAGLGVEMECRIGVIKGGKAKLKGATNKGQ